MINYRRIGIATIMGALLGILCIVGVGGRIDGGYAANATIFFFVSIGGSMGPDIMGWFAGFAYGPIIDLISTYTEKPS